MPRITRRPSELPIERATLFAIASQTLWRRLDDFFGLAFFADSLLLDVSTLSLSADFSARFVSSS
jgi:uncharacterized membrane protein YGL010W